MIVVLRALFYGVPSALSRLWRRPLSAESTAVLLPETRLAGGKNEEKAENECVSRKRVKLAPASPKKH